ncbi:AmmeMemoRadiSam system protein B [Archangium sp.]|uniref:AmmeMemoRadiSam system protein B n=1 Tax=Archangium sp. TaxID=1872627 RepID=UPI002D473C83|nr:AmmeMemoRadiSam system protein B [Archangium sp.]HYO58768.1 AmmeMemoRadiSam system protein B [Archangium sp.]
MARVRAPAVAGSFYPASAPLLAQQVDRCLEQAPACPAPHLVALIVPHAGYIYSGPVAASAYACLRGLKGQVRHVLLLGPCHFVPMNGLAHPDVEALRTPLGDVPVDSALRERAEATRHVTASMLAHRKEHSLEVQLPFLQRVLGDFDVLPLVVGSARPEEVAEVLDALWSEDVLPIISSDLSHYLSYDIARRVDRETADHILRLEGPLEDDRACGAAAINGLLLMARRRGLSARLLDLRNSGDTAGGKSEVVGYGAFAFSPRV